MADFFRNSEGEYVCRICNTSYMELSRAVECSKSHAEAKPSEEAIVVDAEEFAKYKELLDKLDAAGAAGKMCLSMVEDYLLSRSFDMKKTNRPGPLTMSFSKNAAEALINLSKVTGLIASDANMGKKNDLSALSELLVSMREKSTKVEKGG